MDINERLAGDAIRDALAKFPQFAEYGPRVTWHALAQGGAFQVEYAEQPPRDLPDAWDFQNAVVKGYKKLAEVRE